LCQTHIYLVSEVGSLLGSHYLAKESVSSSHTLILSELVICIQEYY